MGVRKLNISLVFITQPYVKVPKEYHNTNKFNGLSLGSKYSGLVLVYQDSNKFSGLKSQKGYTKQKKKIVHNKASELYNEEFDVYKDFSDVERKKINAKLNLVNLLLNTYGYSDWFKKEKEVVNTTPEGDEKEKLADKTPNGDKEEVKEEKGIEILTPNKLLTRLPALKARNN